MVSRDVGDVEHEVVVTCVVTRHSRVSFGVFLAFLVNLFDAFAGCHFGDTVFLADVIHTCIVIGDEQHTHYIRMVLEDVEARASNYDT